MKKQNSAKGFKGLYFGISTLWIVFFGYILFAIAQSQHDKILIFFVMLLPIPIYYILKGFFVGSKKIINQPKYILIIVVLGIIAFVGWNKIGTSVKDKELVVDCFFGNDEDFGIVKISDGKMCLIDPTGTDPMVCAEVSIFNSDIVKTISLHQNTSALVNLLLPDEVKNEIYLKLDRKTGMLGFFYTSDDTNVSPLNRFFNCKKKEKL